MTDLRQAAARAVKLGRDQDDLTDESIGDAVLAAVSASIGEDVVEEIETAMKRYDADMRLGDDADKLRDDLIALIVARSLVARDAALEEAAEGRRITLGPKARRRLAINAMDKRWLEIVGRNSGDEVYMRDYLGELFDAAAALLPTPPQPGPVSAAREAVVRRPQDVLGDPRKGVTIKCEGGGCD